jgi:hypothetical protein
MLLIWARHDAGTVVSWTAAYLVFVVRHATGIALDTSSLPVFEGWRFEPGWSPTSFLGYRYWVTLPALLPLAAGPAAAFLWVLTRRKRTHRADVERGYVLAVAALVVLFGLWFLAVDPTQWGRHLLPAVYASLALATYCVVSAWRSRASGSAAAGTVALVACVAIAALVLGRTRAYAQHEGWHLSHSKTCRGPTVVAPPCWQDKALTMVSSLTVELCDIHGRAFDEDCMKENRRAFLARAGALADQYSGDPEIVATAGYVVLFVEQWAYADEREFFEDLSSLLCEGQRSAIAAYFEAAGAPVDGLLARCDERS